MKLIHGDWVMFTTPDRLHCGAKPSGMFADGTEYIYDDRIVKMILNPDNTMDIWTRDGTLFRAEP